MTNLLKKKNLWTLVFGGLFALLLMPTDSFAQSRKVAKRGGNDVYTAAKANRTTAKRTYNNTTRRTTATATRPTSSTKRTYTNTTRSNAAKKSRTISTNRATRTAQTRAASEVTYSNRRTKRAVDTAPRRASGNAAAVNTRVNNNRNERNTASNFNYTANERNDYCNNYYRGINNWNRTFWTSIHYTPSYYDLTYNRFPYRNGLETQRVRYMGQRLWFYDGIWFKKRFGRYYAIDAPIGLCIDSLPVGGEMIWYRGEKYVIYRGTAYRMLPFGGFQVVRMLTRF